MGPHCEKPWWRPIFSIVILQLSENISRVKTNRVESREALRGLRASTTGRLNHIPSSCGTVRRPNLGCLVPLVCTSILSSTASGLHSQLWE